MNARLPAFLNKVTMVSKRSQQECTAEFAATIAAGTLRALEPVEEYLDCLPADLAAACRKVIGDGTVEAANLSDATAPHLQFYDARDSRAGMLLEWETTVILERVRVKKEEDKEAHAKARLIFVVRLAHDQAWPERKLVGRWLHLAGLTERSPKAQDSKE